jgi:hypothetical protein
MGNKEYVTLLENYKKALAKAGSSVIAAGDKTKLSKLIDDTLVTLRIYRDGDKLIDRHNGIYSDFDKVAEKAKKYNDDVKNEIHTSTLPSSTRRAVSCLLVSRRVLLPLRNSRSCRTTWGTYRTGWTSLNGKR